MEVQQEVPHLVQETRLAEAEDHWVRIWKLFDFRFGGHLEGQEEERLYFEV